MRKSNVYLLTIIAISAFCLFFGLDSALFSSKGEPREAIVAVQILQSGEWILPSVDGIDLPYKPPMLAWLVAAFSSLSGRVTEFTSRIPSVLALMAILIMSYRLFSRRVADKRDNYLKAFIASMILLAAVETHRAAVVCRVDMLLTAFIFAAMISLYNWRQKGWKGFPVAGVLAMSAATLTKGPVGIILPCLAVFVFALLKGDRFWRPALKLFLAAVTAFIIPAAYYYFAYLRGGDRFLALALEENFGRMLGKMSYESHLHPFYYNFVTLLAGMLPFTVFLLFSLFAVRFGKITMKGTLKRFRGADPVLAFSAVAATVVVIFYCFPSSKRSVYLLPAYPFIAFMIAEWMVRLRRRHSHVIKAYNYFLVIVAVIFMAIFAEFYFNFFGLTDHLPEKLASRLSPAASVRHSLLDAIVIAAPIAAIFYAVMIRRRPTGEKHIFAQLGLSLTVYMAVYTSFIAPITNFRSDFTKAKELATIIPKGKILASIKFDNLIRFYTIDFYMDNRVVAMPFDTKEPLPESANILLHNDEADIFIAAHPERHFNLVWNSEKATPKSPKSCDTSRPISLYAFRSALHADTAAISQTAETTPPAGTIASRK